MKPIILSLAAFTLLVGTSFASKTDVAYTSGKLSQTLTIGMRTLSPDTVAVGNKFMLRFYRDPSNLLVCGAQSSLALQVLNAGVAEKRPNGDTNWMAFTAYPVGVSSMVRLDSIGPRAGSPVPYGRAPGYVFGGDGQYSTCSGATYSLTNDHKQVIFVRNGSTYAKFRIFTHTEINESVTPMYQFYYLGSISIRLVVSDNVSDLVDPNPPVGILRAPAKATAPVRGITVTDFYSPLGKKIEIVPGRIHPALSRARGTRAP